MKELQPTAVWHYFHEITQIPRPSKKEEKIIAYLQAFGKNNGLETKTDKIGNVLISKAGTKGCENCETVILQAHVDMVCEKNSDVEFDFDTQPIPAYVDGDWIKTRGTTLGADNGIGMAMMLALLASDDIPHPPLECLFTVEEETGLAGAFALETGFLTGKTLINLDSDTAGEIFVGCAGGIDTVGKIAYKTVETPANQFAFELSVSGLRGGHSGVDIGEERGNANKILNRFLWKLNTEMPVHLASIDGGNLRNAIAREARAVACVPFGEKEHVRVLFNIFVSEMENEKAKKEPDMKFSLESCEIPKALIEKTTSDLLFDTIYACPHGVVAMSADMPGLVETSTNLASVKMRENNIIELTTSQRSSVESAKNDIANMVKCALKLGGCEVTQGEGYPGWKPNLDSAILKKAQVSFEKISGQKSNIRAIHAGLECGLFLEKYPYLDMISIGPTMKDIHSPDERLSISDTKKCFEWLCEILKCK